LTELYAPENSFSVLTSLIFFSEKKAGKEKEHRIFSRKMSEKKEGFNKKMANHPFFAFQRISGNAH